MILVPFAGTQCTSGRWTDGLVDGGLVVNWWTVDAGLWTVDGGRWTVELWTVNGGR